VRIDVTAVASEWEQIEAWLWGGGAGPTKHTGAICAFLCHARRNGYTTEPCSLIIGAGNAEPDAWIEDDEEQLYAEVQSRGGAKWRNLYIASGARSLSAPTC
jgi:hypothetical protein